MPTPQHQQTQTRLEAVTRRAEDLEFALRRLVDQYDALHPSVKTDTGMRGFVASSRGLLKRGTEQ